MTVQELVEDLEFGADDSTREVRVQVPGWPGTTEIAQVVVREDGDLTLYLQDQK